MGAENEKRNHLKNMELTQILTAAASIYAFTLENRSNQLYKYANNAIMGDSCTFCDLPIPAFIKDHQD